MEELDISDVKLITINVCTDEITSSSNIDKEDNKMIQNIIKPILWACGNCLYIAFPLMVISISSIYYHYDSCLYDGYILVEIYTVIHDSFAIIIWTYLLYERFISKHKSRRCRACVFSLNMLRLPLIIWVFILLKDIKDCTQFYFTTITTIIDIIGCIIIPTMMIIMEISEFRSLP